MPTDKQRRKQERFRRHGVERPRSPQLDEKEARQEAEAEQKGKRGAKPSKGRAKKGSSAPRARKPVPFPTLKRALIRAPIFGLIWFVLMRFVLSQGGTSPVQDATQALILTGVMIPLLLLTDSITYRLANRRGVPVQERPRDGYLGFRP